MTVTSRFRSLATLAAIVPLFVAGCAKEEAASTEAMPPQPGSATSAADAELVVAEPTSDAPAASALKVQTVDKAGFDEVIAGHHGKVVLVDMWATWCGPCVKAFPHTVELAKKYGADGLAVVSLSFDDPDSLDAVEAFLTKQDAQFDNLLSQYGADEQSYEDFGVETGALPHYQLFDREGKLARELTSGDPTAPRSATPEDVEAAIRELLAAPPGDAGN